ncbi:MAG: tetratricopeptide repeat protein [Myxococcota bacterium]|nr:tetratricopeptide repeat protein [Myxococcota bacterium]
MSSRISVVTIAALSLLICAGARAQTSAVAATDSPSASPEKKTADAAGQAEAVTDAQGKNDKSTKKSLTDQLKAEAKPKNNAVPGPAEAKALERGQKLGLLSREVTAFEAEIKEYRGDIKRLVDLQYQRKRRYIRSRYSRLLDNLTVEERIRRKTAIERFEKFLVKYPRNPKYTPDAQFRLAELYFERSNDEYVTALEKYEDMVNAADEGKLKALPDEPKQDYSLSIALFDRLTTDWPNYRNIDGALYLKGYCLSEMGDIENAITAFTQLVENYPKSRFVAETWTRIGEYYFDENKLTKAIAAYLKVIEQKDSPFYDKALYKLAWTFYRNDQYPDAIARFRELIEFSDKKAKKTGKAGSDLRAEAIQYLAISIQEDDWDGDGETDPGAGFNRVMEQVRGEKPYDVEVLRALAGIFFDNAKYDEAVATIRHLLKTFPDYDKNPELHSQMITAYERLQRFEDAFAERDRLASAYGPNTRWRNANDGDPKALGAADELMEDALIQAAQYHHSRAQQLKAKLAEGDVSVEADVVREYELAGSAYEKYLTRFPNSENAYALNFFYAECLYYSSRFAKAALQYAKTRDSKLGTKYRENAAFYSILAYEMSIRDYISAGRFAAKPSLIETGEGPTATETTQTSAPDEENDGTARVIEPETIPSEVQALLQARQTYFDMGLVNTEDRRRLPVIIYKLGETYFDYKNFDEARKWFALLIDKYPKERVAGFAATAIIDSYRQVNDWKKMAEWAERIADAGLGREYDEEIRTLKVGALFKEAERLYKDGKFEKAAREYVRLVDENPGNRYADRALNNAAVAFEKIRRFESATKTYERIYREYPKSNYVEEALFQVGVNSERFYDFDKAITTHLQLVGQFPQSTHRADSLYQASVLQERTQKYRPAAQNYERYATLFPMRKDTAETFFRAGKTYEKLGDTANEIRIYKQFVKDFGSDPAQNARVIEGLARIATIYQTQGQSRRAAAAWEEVINEFNRRGMQVGTYEARFPAQAAFELVEMDFKEYTALKLSGSLRNQGRILKDMQRRIKELDRRYKEVLAYKSPLWNIAALFRLGHILQLFAESLYSAPIPNMSEEEQDIYRTQLEDLAVPIEDEAVKKFVFADKKARELKITNVWTKRTVASLNKYKPSDYPLFKEEKRIFADRQLTSTRLLTLPKTESAETGDEDGTPTETDGLSQPASSEDASTESPDSAAPQTPTDAPEQSRVPDGTPPPADSMELFGR